MSSPASANSATWWSLMENSDTSDGEQHYARGRKYKPNSSIARNRSSYEPPTTPAMRRSSTMASKKSHHSSRRRSSAPMPQPASNARANAWGHAYPYDEYRHEHTTIPSKITPKRSTSEKAIRKKSHSTPRSTTRGTPRNKSNRGFSHGDDEDSEHKKVRWEQPETHLYQLAEQPRLLEEKFFNVIESVQSNMNCSKEYQKTFNASNLVWSLIDTSRNGRDKSMNQGTDSTSQAQSTEEEGSMVDSIFEDGPSEIEIFDTPPVFSESITASDSLLSSQDSGDDDDDDNKSVERRHHRRSGSNHRHQRSGTCPIPADSSKILDDLSCMESERRSSGTDSDRVRQKTNEVEYGNVPNRNTEPISIINKDSGAPSVKIYSTALPFEMEKEKKCFVGMQALQDIQRARDDKAAEKRNHKALRQKLKDNPNVPPIPDIHVGASHEVSTISASEGSFNSRKYSSMHPDYRNYKQDKSGLQMGGIPENKGLKIESHSKLLFDNNFQDETKSCMPISFQRKKRSGDGATASHSSKSLGLRLLSRSADANTTSEKEEDTESPYLYEYETGINTYVAYFETSISKETRPALKVIEHPNPPLLPFGSNEVVVKIEASTISQSDCAIRRGEWWGGTLSLPRIPGVAFAGRIDQIHKTGRNSMQVGDQVLSLVCSGGNSRYVCIPRDRLIKVPSNANLASAKVACLPEIYLSAFQLLHNGQSGAARYRKNALAGKTIMFLGGASALGQAIVELSVEAGAAVVYATASKVKQFQRIIEIGGIPLSDNPTEWLPTINQQVDILIGCTADSLKDTDPLTYDHFNVLKKKGQLVLLGGPGTGNEYPVIHPGIAECQVDVFKILKKAYKHNVFENWERDMKQSKRDLNHLIALLQKDALKPKILERIPLSKVAKAEEIAEARRLHGVLICEPWIKEKQR